VHLRQSTKFERYGLFDEKSHKGRKDALPSEEIPELEIATKVAVEEGMKVVLAEGQIESSERVDEANSTIAVDMTDGLSLGPAKC
jgi:hypothetical protein